VSVCGCAAIKREGECESLQNIGESARGRERKCRSEINAESFRNFRFELGITKVLESVGIFPSKCIF